MKIELNTLRVGNIIAYCTEPVVVQTIGRNTIGFTDNKNEFQREVNNTNFAPILLRPQWLENAGFDVKKGNSTSNYIYWCTGYAYLVRFNEDGIAIFLHAEGQVTQIEHVKYLHQLQNLHFGVRGDELDIKL
jgi:hypothetical protein